RSISSLSYLMQPKEEPFDEYRSISDDNQTNSGLRNDDILIKEEEDLETADFDPNEIEKKQEELEVNNQNGFEID
ncbi:hypothetical protein PMAYCL1PPCAC_19608, partial [Pristionchus mayeri]